MITQIQADNLGWLDTPDGFDLYHHIEHPINKQYDIDMYNQIHNSIVVGMTSPIMIGTNDELLRFIQEHI